MTTRDKSTEIIKQLKDNALESSRTSSLAARLRNRYSGKVLLCDVSGSMDGSVDCSNPEAPRRIDVVQEVIKNFLEYPIYEFSGFNSYDYRNQCCREVIRLSKPHGGTPMHDAFDFLKSRKFKEIILLTDGEPDSQDAALEAAIGLKIDTIYIGVPPTPHFLQRLAGETSGTFIDFSEAIKIQGNQTLLKNIIKGLLGA